MASFLLKRKRFLVSFIFLFTLFTWSLLHGDDIRQVMYVKDDQGNILKRAPFPPMNQFFFGSDQFGYDMGEMMLVGAKWTIGITILVTIFRMLLSMLLSSFIYSLNDRLYNAIKSIFEPFSVVPQTIIAYFILYSVLWMPKTGFLIPFWERALFHTFILIILAIPNLTIQLSSEMRQVEKESFIEASRVLGSRTPYIFFKHIIPHVYEKWILLFGQQFLHTLLLLAHLGFLKLFFGGTYVPYGDPSNMEPPHSVSYEWSGVLGGNISYLYANQWIILVPIAAFMITAICAALINGSIKAYLEKKSRLQK